MASVALQSEDHRHLLDIIDKLRSQGISRYVDLPEIIVCGDQSAGKSSVLEAISGMSFPTKDNLCTRFPTELVLRRGEVTAPRVSINPGPGRSEEERERLRSFHATMDPEDRWSLSNIVEDAKAAMLLSDSKEFSTDTLRIELSGPQQPHLTMVDLPGLFRAGNRDQSVANSKTVRKMVRGYMKRPRSIILAVVSAKSDAALQEVTELARDLDPTGDRTLGLITKPDCLDEGSEMQASFMSLAKNENVVFRLGWHVLKNRSYEMRNASLFERDEAEEEFFSKGIWAGLERKYVGVASLKPRLSNVLKEQILRQLPSLLRDIEAGIQDCQHGLQRLGTPRITAAEQRRYLLQVSQQFSALMSGAVEGVYNAPFFGSSKTDEGYRKRLRAVVQNTLSDFSERVRKEGRSLTIIESDEEDGYLGPSNAVSRDNYLDQVKRMMRRNRGCELPGTFNPLIVGELFTEQCRPWRGLAQAVSEDIFEAVYQTIQAILDHVAVPEVAEGILVIINSAIDKLKANCKHKLTELLTPHESGHPITYNHYLTDQVQKVQSERRKKASEKKFMEHLGSHVFSNNDFGSWKSEFPTNSLVNLLDALADSTEADMERQAASLAVDYMQAYYKVAQKVFVDGVAVLTIEQSLIKKLPSAFSPDVVFELDDEEIHRIVAESDETSVERSRYTEKLSVLEDGLHDLKRLDRHRSAAAGKTSGHGGDTFGTAEKSEFDEGQDGSLEDEDLDEGADSVAYHFNGSDSGPIADEGEIVWPEERSPQEIGYISPPAFISPEPQPLIWEESAPVEIAEAPDFDNEPAMKTSKPKRKKKKIDFSEI